MALQLVDSKFDDEESKGQPTGSGSNKQMTLILNQIEELKREKLPQLQKKMESQMSDQLLQFKVMIGDKIKKVKTDVDQLKTALECGDFKKIGSNAK